MAFLTFLLVVVLLVGTGMLFNMYLYTNGAVRSRRFAAVPATETETNEQFALSLGAPDRSLGVPTRRLALLVIVVTLTLMLLFSMLLSVRF